MTTQVRLTTHSLFVVLAVALELCYLLVCPSLALGTQDDQISCWSGQPDTTCTRSTSCGVAAQSSSLEMCSPSYGQRFTPYPEDYNSDCNCGTAATANESALYDGTPRVSVTFETVSVFRFNMEVNWSHSLSNNTRVRGYQVRLHLRQEHWGFTSAFCYCVQGSDARSLEIRGRSFLMFSNYFQMLVEVQAYPFPPYDSNHPDVTGKNCSLWSDCDQDPTGSCGSCRTFPSSCLDLGLNNCHVPKFQPPTNVELYTHKRPLNGTLEQAMQLDILWDPPVVQNEYQVPNNLLTYFLRLRYIKDNGLRGRIDFNASGNGSISISLFPLDLTLWYSVNLLTHYNCAGTDDYLNGIDEIGCGRYGSALLAQYVPPVTTSKVAPVTMSPASRSYASPTPSLSAILSSVAVQSTSSSKFLTTVQLVLSSKAAVQSTSSLTLSMVLPSGLPTEVVGGTDKPHPLMEPTVIATIASVVFAFLIIILIMSSVLFILRRYHSNVSLLTTETSEKVPVHVPIERECLKVFVMYSPRTNPTDKEYILTYVVNGLRRHCRKIIVTYPDHSDFIRGCVVGKIEEKVKQSQAVLIVCNTAFQEDWDDEINSSQHVRSLRQLIYSNVGRNQKFALVTLDNDPYCVIPSEYLKPLKRFNIGRKGADEKDMIHFVTNTAPYQLVHPQDLSPLSDITANLCDSQNSILTSTTSSSYSLCEPQSLPLSENGLNLLSKTLSDEVGISRSSTGHKKECTESTQVNVVRAHAMRKIPNFTKSHNSADSQHQ